MQIHIAPPEDQHNTTLTCPSDIFMQYTCYISEYMLNIFSYLIKSCLEVFMDNSTVHLSSFATCLHYLELFFLKCIKTNLMLNYLKYHFLVNKDIILSFMKKKDYS